jgi:hypothetical protein
MTSSEQISHQLPALIKFLTLKGIDSRYLEFGGADPEPAKLPRVPTDARSEFLANRAMGDWAENILSDQIAKSNDLQIAHYGNTERISAGDEGFKEYYYSALEEVRLFGKRPDLLVFSKGLNIPSDLSALIVKDSDPFAKQAIAAIEVRSSKFEALKYMEVRKKEKELGKSGNETPSFTVKVEDLRIVYRWIERLNISQTYCQVFLDSVYAINVKKIFEIIASGKNIKVDNPIKSQMKTTIMIPITSGEMVGKFNKLPSFEAEAKISRLGRHDAYVKPVGGDLELDFEALKRVLTA